MHAIQGAVAVRRERQKREQRRQSKQAKRRSAEAAEAGMAEADSTETLFVDGKPPPKTESSLTAFHLGIVFILIGFLLVFSGMVNKDVAKLLGVGTTLIIVGLLMVMVNRIITAREEEELARYVQNRLARTRSGHALAHAHRPSPRPQRASSRRGQHQPPKSGSAHQIRPPSKSGSGQLHAPAADGGPSSRRGSMRANNGGDASRRGSFRTGANNANASPRANSGSGARSRANSTSGRPRAGSTTCRQAQRDKESEVGQTAAVSTTAVSVVVTSEKDGSTKTALLSKEEAENQSAD